MKRHAINELGMKEKFKDLGKKTKDLVQSTTKKIDETFKKIKKEKWERRPEVIAHKQRQENKKRFKELKRDTTSKINEVKQIAIEIKEDTTEIKMNISNMASIVDCLNSKAEALEEFLKDNLGSDWEKIKHKWQACKSGEISKGQFLREGFKIVGMKFLNIFSKV